jgi:predicted nucleic acid-binding protein
MRKVLDAWAILAWLEGQAAKPVVDALLESASRGDIEAYMNMINAGEVYYQLARRRGMDQAEEFLEDLDSSLPIKTIVPSRALIIKAAQTKSKYPVSYADAFAVETAVGLSAALVTGDPELRAIPGLKLEWIG